MSPESASDEVNITVNSCGVAIIIKMLKKKKRFQDSLERPLKFEQKHGKFEKLLAHKL